MADNMPEKLGKYEIIRELGRGTTGVVYEGRGVDTNRRFAVKISTTDQFTSERATERYRQRFFNESSTACRLQNPNIVRVFDSGTQGNRYYIAMELVEGGRTLKSHCRPDRLLPYKQVAEIVFKCARALDYAHHVGVVHRDIKPTNILMADNGDIKLCDFSIAHLMTEEAENTMPTGFVGSPRYMSPEQIQEDMITHQTDLFSFGIVMYELLTGHHPFLADGFSGLMHKIINVPPPPLRNYRTGMPEIFERIIHHILQKDPEKRYQNAAAIIADLGLAYEHLNMPQEDRTKREMFEQVHTLDCFKEFSETEIWELLHVCTWQEYKTGEQITDLIEGQEENLSIVIVGQIEIRRKKNLLKCFGPGDCFGNKAYFTKMEQNATMYTKDFVRLLRIDETVLNRLSVGCRLNFNKIFLKTLLRL